MKRTALICGAGLALLLAAPVFGQSTPLNFDQAGPNDIRVFITTAIRQPISEELMKDADKAVGIPHDSPQRVKAGIQFTLSEASGNGNCFLPQDELIAKAVEILTVSSVTLPEASNFTGRPLALFSSTAVRISARLNSSSRMMSGAQRRAS